MVSSSWQHSPRGQGPATALWGWRTCSVKASAAALGWAACATRRLASRTRRRTRSVTQQGQRETEGRGKRQQSKHARRDCICGWDCVRCRSLLDPVATAVLCIHLSPTLPIVHSRAACVRAYVRAYACTVRVLYARARAGVRARCACECACIGTVIVDKSAPRSCLASGASAVLRRSMIV